MSCYGVPNRPRTQGFALVVSLLFTGIVLLIVMFTAATLATGTRQGGANERNSYHALLVAESGLNTLPRRAAEYVRIAPYAGTTTAHLQTWLTGLQATVAPSMPPGSSVALTALPGSTTTFTAVYRGGNGSASRVVAQDYVLTPRTLPPGVRPRSAVTALNAIDGNGSARVSVSSVNGGPVTTVSGSGVTLPALGTSTTVPVADASALRSGDYVRISDSTFRITGLTAATLDVTRVPGATTSPQVLSGSVDVLLGAVAASYGTVTTSMPVAVSNARDYVVGETVTVAGTAARITALDLSVGTATLDWTGTPPSALPEGTPVYRDVTALRSAGTVTPNANTLEAYTGTSGGVPTVDCATATTCRGQNDPVLEATDPSELTPLLFGLTDHELNDLVPMTSGPVFPTLSGGIMRIRGADFDAALKNTSSSGVLIVDGDILSSLNGNTTFTGFIYVRGSTVKFSSGRFTLNGGLAVQGSAGSTDITGNLTVTYDAVRLRSMVGKAGGSVAVDAVAGTWRLR